jgi:hypothetical protein
LDSEISKLESYSKSNLKTTELKEINGKLISQKIDAIKIRDYQLELKIVIFFSIFLFIIGNILVTYGFRNWYYKIQKPIDEKTQLEIKEIKQRLK